MSDFKDRYIYMRNKKVVDINFFYDYAIHSGYVGTFDEFFNAFKMFTTFVGINTILVSLDKKFELTIVFDCEDRFIKVVDNPIK